jgi:branched-chain amino acid transport system permease protein
MSVSALRWPVLLGALLSALGAQSLLYAGQERVATTVLMFVALAAAWNLIGGFAGYACFGQVGFFGIGGYTTAILMSHWPLAAALGLAAVVAGGFAALIGAPLLRLKGHYFAVATLGVAEGLHESVVNVPRLTGGGAGLTIPVTGTGASTGWLGNDGFYLLFLALAGAAVAVALLVSTSRAGYALRALHQDEDAAAAGGVNTTAAKVLTFAASAAVTGAIGGAYAFQQVTIFPDRLFDADITVLTIVMVVLGGSGTVVGPVVGAVLIATGSEWLRQSWPEVNTLLLGALVIAAVVLLPQGLTVWFGDAVRSRRFSLLDNVRRFRL